MTYFFLSFGIMSFVIAFLIGISDNTPGVLLCYLGFMAMLLAWTHRWRSIKKYLILIAVSVIGFPIAVTLHNLFYALAEMSDKIVVINQLFNVLSVTFFIIAVLVCPPGLVLGAVGSILMLFVKRKSYLAGVDDVRDTTM